MDEVIIREVDPEAAAAELAARVPALHTLIEARQETLRIPPELWVFTFTI